MHFVWSCAVCVGAFDKNRVAFLATTAFMTALPLSLVGALAAWLRRKARFDEAHPESDQDASPL